MSIKLQLMGELSTLMGKKKVTIEISESMPLKEALELGLKQDKITGQVFKEIIEGKYMYVCNNKQVTLEDKVDVSEEIFIIPPIQGGVR